MSLFNFVTSMSCAFLTDIIFFTAVPAFNFLISIFFIFFQSLDLSRQVFQIFLLELMKSSFRHLNRHSSIFWLSFPETRCAASYFIAYINTICFTTTNLSDFFISGSRIPLMKWGDVSLNIRFEFLQHFTHFSVIGLQLLTANLLNTLLTKSKLKCTY